jgi:chemotaxis protein MotB
MSKKKHPEHVNHERWLVSYADFITLLFAFFVVLFASGQNDKRKQVKLAQAMQSAFQYNGIFDQHAKTPPISDDAQSAPTAAPSPLMLPVPSAIEQDKILKEQVKDQIEDVIHNQVALKQIGATSVNIHDSDQGLVVSLHEAGFFNSGSADIRPQAMDTLRAIANILPHQAMRVEGHTDDIPIHTAQFATNWELSTARAAGITRLLIAQHAVDPAEISATGYAEFHPVASNATEDGRQENRRVDIILLKPSLAGENAPAPPSPAAPGSGSKP